MKVSHLSYIAIIHTLSVMLVSSNKGQAECQGPWLSCFKKVEFKKLQTSLKWFIIEENRMKFATGDSGYYKYMCIMWAVLTL